MKNKQIRKAIYFFAPLWDSKSIYKLNKFIDACERISLRYECVDVDTIDGTKLSIKYGVRNVPCAILLSKDKKVVSIEKGNDIHNTLLDKYEN